MKVMDANQLRQAFVGYFVERGHHYLPSASLVSQDPTVMFTVAGMVPLKPYYLGEQVPPHPRLTSIQRCVRVRGKHDDIDVVGTDTRHLTFFEMLGNFSLGDYFKAEAITMAWELLTEVLGLEADRLWVTVHEDDAEAAAIWVDKVGLAPERVQALGEDNLWAMGEVGPCGPDSEIFYDKGDDHGAGGGPAGGDDERYVELWNLVFMQHNRAADGSVTELPSKNIDTGAGLERILPILAGTESVFDTDVLRPIVAAAESVTGASYGTGGRVDVGLRILADHARAMVFLVSDGVLPANEARGYVLRRIIRRALRWGTQLGATGALGPPLVEAVVATMGPAYPELVAGADMIATVVAAEEERFGRTLRAGQGLLGDELARATGGRLAGPVAFRLHDTYGFPIELTAEIAAEAGLEVDRAGFEAAMADQRARAREAAGRGSGATDTSAYRGLLADHGPTVFTGYDEATATATVVGVLEAPPTDGAPSNGDVAGPGGRPGDVAGPGGRPDDVEIVLDRSPFYAEGGGQVGDTGTITTDTGVARVTDTTYALPGLVVHQARVTEGHIGVGQSAVAAIDAERREAIRRNHTGTHLLHWALREVLGPHVKQQGSLVAPDRLRFDFSHFAPLTDAETEAVADLVNATILADDPVEVIETSWGEAEALGAIAFFGDKYGDRVRVVRAGPGSVELCGGTHVQALGMIGPLQIVSEASIGSGTRRLEALTGRGALGYIKDQERLLADAARILQTTPEGLTGALERLQASSAASREELKALRSAALGIEAATLAAGAERGLVVARRDELGPDQLKELALATRARDGVAAVVLAGTPDTKRVALVAAVAKDSGLVAAELLAEPARLVGGGGGKGPELALAGGRDPGRIDEAVALVRADLGLT